jgi:tRNA pseudouridine55 synthase
MGRRRKGSPIHGWVFLDKPLGLGSTQAVSMVRRAFNAQKAGHAGTLDPLATGLLAIALGEATKTVPYMMDADKTYTFTIKWGETTSTGDADERGEVIATSAVRPSRANIESVLPRFMGEIGQVPPAYSAIKVDGQRAYDLARAGQDVEIKSRNVRIESLRLVECPDEDHATFEVSCSKGTYVRSLGQDIARALGTEGHLSMLSTCCSWNVRPSEPVSGGAKAPACPVCYRSRAEVEGVATLNLRFPRATRHRPPEESGRTAQPVCFVSGSNLGGSEDARLSEPEVRQARLRAGRSGRPSGAANGPEAT